MGCFLLAFLWSAQADADPTVPQLVRQLGSDRIEARESALRRLKEIGSAAAPKLRELQKGADAEEAGRIQALLRWYAFSDSLSPRLKQAFPRIADRLLEAPDPAWTELFLNARALRHPQFGFESMTRRDLDPLVVRALAGASAKDDLLEIFEACGRLGLEPAAPRLATFLSHPDAEVRFKAASILGWMRHRAAAPEMRKLLHDESGVVRGQVALALGELDDPAAVPRILELLRGRADEPARDACIVALGMLRAEDAVPDLIRLADPPSTRRAAVEALARIGDLRAVPCLVALLKDDDEESRFLAVQALSDLQATQAADAVLPLLKASSEEMQALAAAVLGEWRFGKAVPQLLGLLSHREANLRREACRALGTIRADDALPGLAARLEDRVASVRHEAALALARMGRPEHLAEAFRDATGGFFRLNEFANPAAWDRLRGVRIGRDLRGTSEEIVQRLAKEAGLSVHWEPPADDRHAFWRERYRSRTTEPGHGSGAQLLAAMEQPYSFVLEGDSLRALLPESARTYWSKRLPQLGRK